MQGEIPAAPNENGDREVGGPLGGPGGFDVSQLDMEDEGSDSGDEMEPHFLGDARLLYSAEAGGETGRCARRMMVFQGAVNGHQAVVLLDLGANANYVSKEWASRTGIQQRALAQSVDVTTATGATYTATTQLMCTDVRVVGKAHKTSLVIVPLGTYDVILGTPWFKATKPQFDWEQWTCNGRSVYAKGGRSVGHPGRRIRRLQSMAIGADHASRMGALVSQYSDVFATVLPKRVARAGALVHSFSMKADAKPIRDGERRRSPEELRLIREMVAEGMASGIIEDSSSDWCSQLHMVIKKDQHGVPTGKPRFCTDYRGVNQYMVKDAHPLPLPAVMFDQLRGATIFSKLDLTKGFYQIGLAPSAASTWPSPLPMG